MNVIAIPTAHVLTTAAWIKKLAYVIALIGTVASYGTQVGLLLSYEVGAFGYVIPATVDLLAICAALALQLPNLDATSRKIAGWILLVAVTVSVAANVTGGHNTVARLAHAWPVIAYLLGELLANRVRSFAARLVAAEAAKGAATAVPVHATATVAAPTQTVAAVNVAVPAILRRPPVAVPAAVKLLPIVSAVALTKPAITARPRQRVAPAAQSRTTVTASVPATAINPRTGQPYSERHTRRLRTGR